MANRTSIAAWLDQEELPDFYRLLGRRRLDPDVEGLVAAVKGAARELLPYQNHADPAKARRAMSLLTELGRIEALLANPQRLSESNQEIVSQLVSQCAVRFAGDGPSWKHDEVRSWLEREQNVSPAALRETLAAVSAALPQPQPVVIPIRVFGGPREAPSGYGGEALHVAPLAAKLAPYHDEGTRPATACPDCGSSVAAGSVLCINCGFDFRTGQKVAVKTSGRVPSARPLPPAGQNAKASAAARTSTWYRPWMTKVALAAVAALLVMTVGAAWLVVSGKQPGHGVVEEPAVALAAKRSSPPPETAPITKAVPAVRVPQPPPDRRTAGAGQAEDAAGRGVPPPAPPPVSSTAAPPSRLPTETKAAEALRAFNTAYQRAVTAAPQEAEAAWARALQLAPDAASRLLVHRARVAMLMKAPPPLSTADVEKLCAEFDAQFVDAQSVGERLMMADALLFALRQKRAVQAGLGRYAALSKSSSNSELQQTIVKNLAQECFNELNRLPVSERWQACQRIIELSGGDEAARLAGYQSLATNPEVMRQAPLERLWEVYDLILDRTPEGPLAMAYLQALVDQVRRRGVVADAVRRYEAMARGGNGAFAQRVLKSLADPKIAGPKPAAPGNAPAPTAPRAPLDEAAETLVEYLRLLGDADHCAKASDAELEKMYDFVVENAADVVDPSRLAGTLLVAFDKKRHVPAAIRRYEQKLRKDKNSLAALYFLAEAYGWRAGENFLNAKRREQDLARRDEMLQRLAGAQPGSRTKAGPSKRPIR